MNKSIDKPITISDLTKKIKSLLEGALGKIFVEGEISNWRPASSGHCYFALKDDKALIKAVIFRSDFARVGFKPSEGMKVEVHGYMSVYEGRGEYQIIVSSMREAGVGDLFKRFSELKEKLAKEGLFDISHKKPLPFLPQKIGVVTSPTGAAIRDILNILNRRFANCEVIIAPVKVQGEGAADEIAAAILRMNTLALVEVMIVGRGGGSIEDLWSFNEEKVARAIYKSKIPIISAVGHEIDFTIADFVADLRAPTPSAAAELVVRNREDLLTTITSYEGRLQTLLKNKIEILRTQHERLAMSWGFKRPEDMLVQYQQKIDDLSEGIIDSVMMKIERRSNAISKLNAHLFALDPEAVLNRGYSIVYKKKSNRIVKSPTDVKNGETLKIQSAGGIYEALAAESMPLFDFEE